MNSKKRVIESNGKKGWIPLNDKTWWANLYGKHAVM